MFILEIANTIFRILAQIAKHKQECKFNDCEVRTRYCYHIAVLLIQKVFKYVGTQTNVCRHR